MLDAYNDGYHHGLINDRTNPHHVFSPLSTPWRLGNLAGVAVHCAIVEAIYLHEAEEITSK
jgi:hypothetical protein